MHVLMSGGLLKWDQIIVARFIFSAAVRFCLAQGLCDAVQCPNLFVLIKIGRTRKDDSICLSFIMTTTAPHRGRAWVKIHHAGNQRSLASFLFWEETIACGLTESYENAFACVLLTKLKESD